jgi:rhomboid protease GluP
LNVSEPPAAREFLVRFSTGQPSQAGQPPNNTYGLSGEGKLIVDGSMLTFEGDRTGFHFAARGPVRIKVAEIANVDYKPGTNAFLIHTRDGQHYIIVWASSREDAESIWSLLPQGKTPEFVADQEHHDRFASAMAALGRRWYVTPSIIAINVAVFVVMWLAGADFFNPSSSIAIRFGSNLGPLTWTGEEWRLLTSAFLHFGIIHITLNMYALFQGGALVERLYGSSRFALIYLLAAVAGSVASGWWNPLRDSAGASGAIFGVYGALLAFLVIRRTDIPPRLLKRIGSSALLFCLYSLAYGWANTFIDNACHIGGLLAGFLSGLILARPFNAEARERAQPARLLIAAVAIGFPLIWLAQPLVAQEGSRGAGLRLERDTIDFAPIEADLVRKQTEILTAQQDLRVGRLDLAKRLRDEVLVPWREASKPLLQSQSLPQDGSRAARMQVAMRDYLRAREEFLALRVLSLESGDLSDEARALSADHRVEQTLNVLDAIARE